MLVNQKRLLLKRTFPFGHQRLFILASKRNLNEDTVTDDIGFEYTFSTENAAFVLAPH